VVSYKQPRFCNLPVCNKVAYRLPVWSFTTPWKGWSVNLFMRKAHFWYFLFTSRQTMQPVMQSAMLNRCFPRSPLQLWQSQEPS
jgi:hypothetical protein